jgi:hypothetical protein
MHDIKTNETIINRVAVQMKRLKRLKFLRLFFFWLTIADTMILLWNTASDVPYHYGLMSLVAVVASYVAYLHFRFLHVQAECQFPQHCRRMLEELNDPYHDEHE